MKETAATLPTGAEEPELTVPRMADYEILGVLGEGGMGIVYKARDLRLDRFVALKMIRWGGSTRPEDLARFEAEAKAVAAIEHPNIVRIFEIGEYGGTPYCSLEFLAGGSLAERQGGKPLPAREAARVTELLARAMTAVHRAGIIHRDLKPANVLYAADDTPKITDFGLVKRFEDESGRTRTGSILGTASYMAPEQARGEPNRIGPAADQYSLGAVLYELLTGRPPFRGVSVLDTLDQVRNNEPVPPSRLQPKLPRDLETICLKCLEKDPARRYPQVSALAEDLHRFASGEPIVARPVSAPERLGRWCLRNKVVAALTGVTLALLLTIVAGTVYGYLAPKRQNLALESANKRATRKQFEAEQKQRLAENVARFFHEQNRRALDTHVEMMNLLSSKLQHVPGIEDTRGAFLDKATKGVEVSAQAMIDIRQEIGGTRTTSRATGGPSPGLIRLWPTRTFSSIDFKTPSNCTSAWTRSSRSSPPPRRMTRAPRSGCRGPSGNWAISPSTIWAIRCRPKSTTTRRSRSTKNAWQKCPNKNHSNVILPTRWDSSPSWRCRWGISIRPVGSTGANWPSATAFRTTFATALRPAGSWRGFTSSLPSYPCV